MAIYLNDNLSVLAPRPADKRYGTYSSVAEALSAIEPIVRHQGLTAGVVIGGQLKEYWFRDGITDPDFIEKTFGGPVDAPEHVFILQVTGDDETVSVGPNQYHMRLPFSIELLDITASLTLEPEGSNVIIDVFNNGISIFATPVNIDPLTLYSDVSETGKVLQIDRFNLNSEFTVNVDQVGSVQAGKGLKVYLIAKVIETSCDLPPYLCSTDVNPYCVTDFTDAWNGICTSIEEFPPLDVSSGVIFTRAWANCISMDTFPALNTSSGTDFEGTWFNCYSLSPFPLIDTSKGVNFALAWSNCFSLQSFPELDLSQGENFVGTWKGCSGLTSFPELNVSQGENFVNTWQDCSGLTSFPSLDFSSGVNFFLSWAGCSSLTSFPNVSFPLGTSFDSAWRDCSSLTEFLVTEFPLGSNFNSSWEGCSNLLEFPLISFGWSVGNFTRSWANCSSLTSFPELDFSEMTQGGVTQAWSGCSSLVTFPALDVSNFSNFYGAWSGCSSLVTFPSLDFSSGAYFGSAWQDCSSLTTFPSVSFPNGLSFGSAWQDCSSLTTFPANAFDTCVATDFGNAWFGCALDQTSVDNILLSLNAAGQLNGNVNLSGGTSSAPGAAGLVAQAALQAKGWSILVNTSPCDSPPYGCNTGVDPYCITDFTSAWAGCSSITVFPAINLSSGLIFQQTWENCSNMLTFSLVDVSSGTNFDSAWKGCSNLTDFPALNLSEGTTFQSSWQDCSSLSTFPAGVFDSCTATNFTNAWNNCSLDQISVDNILVSIDLAGQVGGTLHLNGGTSSSPSLAGFTALSSLESKGWVVYINGTICDVPPYACNTSVNPYCVTDFSSAWSDCSSLTSFPLLDVSSGSNFTNTWKGCSGLVSFPSLTFSSGTSFASTWKDCSSLTTFPPNLFDSCSAIDFSGAWDNCALSQTSVDNILLSLEAAGQFNGIVTFIGGTTSSPSVTGLAAKVTLESRGWTVSFTAPPSEDYYGSWVEQNYGWEEGFFPDWWAL